jgi:hypothetical protein
MNQYTFEIFEVFSFLILCVGIHISFVLYE